MEENPPPARGIMDDLLHRLRHDMVDLSSQGDHFTHQIWLMYGEFEQVVDQLNPPASKPSTTVEQKPCNTTKMVDTKMAEEKRFESDDESGSDNETVTVRYSRTGPCMNPLLETISAIEDFCDSDEEDATDGPVSAYAGSNSVDSGYKSSCPTPDLPVRTAAPAPALAPKPAIPKPPRRSKDPELDHLTSLRKTLLTAIERYDTRTKQLDQQLANGRSLRPRSISPHQRGLDCQRTNQLNRSCRMLRESSADPLMPTVQPTVQGPQLADGDESAKKTDDGATSTRFSRMAHCMLEIIEDLQRQQQQQTMVQPKQPSPVVPPKPTRASKMASSTVLPVPAPATPPRVARRGRRKLPTPQPPPAAEDDDLNGADYHLYEEILYDLGGQSSAKPTVEQPPPLPARPIRPAVINCDSISVTKQPWLDVISKPLRRDRNNQLIRTNNWMAPNIASKLQADNQRCSQGRSRSNLYTFGTQPVAKPRYRHHEDEYGFRAAMV